jgi:hypothetical protein
MRFMPTRAHGMMDWVMGPVLIALPFALGLDVEHPAGWIFLVVGIGALILSAFTDYELGLVPRIAMPTHLAVDAAAGALLALSPWLFGFSSRIWVPHFLFGLLEVGTSFITRRRPTPSHQHSAASRA